MKLKAKCLLCPNMASHSLGYTNLNDESNWVGVYCNFCFVRKLQGIYLVWKKKNISTKNKESD